MRTEASKQALTQGPIRRSLIFFALPIFLSNLFQQLYNSADSIIVGQFLGKQALAAVSSSGSLGFFNGTAVGAGVVIARLFGAKKYEDMRRAVHTDLAFAIAAGIILTVLGVAFTPVLLKWMRTPDEVLPQSVEYFRVYFYGASAVVLYNICVGILQAVGDSRHPLYYLIFSACLNVVLDLLFIGVFHMGVGSAAAATAISQAVSALLCLVQLVRTKEVYKVSLKEIRFHKDMLGQILRYGLPSGVQNSVIAIANVVVQSNINSFGDDAMAGCGTYAKLEGFAFLPITCFTMALTTFVSQNLGAKAYDRVKKGIRVGIFCSVTIAETVALLIFIFSPKLIGLFTGDAESIAFGVMHERTTTPFFFLLAYSHCMAAIFRGAGKSTVLNIVIGFNKPTSGQVLIDGHDINTIDLHSYRKFLAVVPQTSILFNGTIRENITYGMPSVTEEQLQQAIEAANLTDLIASLPDGLNTVVGEHGGKLSGGQRQRISIARAIIRDPRVIVFDEATSALDSISEKQIQTAINNLTRDRTTFIVAHRLSTIRDADKIAVLREGHCVEYGTFDELMQRKGEFYKMKVLQS